MARHALDSAEVDARHREFDRWLNEYQEDQAAPGVFRQLLTESPPAREVQAGSHAEHPVVQRAAERDVNTKSNDNVGEELFNKLQKLCLQLFGASMLLPEEYDSNGCWDIEKLCAEIKECRTKISTLPRRTEKARPRPESGDARPEAARCGRDKAELGKQKRRRRRDRSTLPAAEGGERRRKRRRMQSAVPGASELAEADAEIQVLHEGTARLRVKRWVEDHLDDDRGVTIEEGEEGPCLQRRNRRFGVIRALSISVKAKRSMRRR